MCRCQGGKKVVYFALQSINFNTSKISGAVKRSKSSIMAISLSPLSIIILLMSLRVIILLGKRAYKADAIHELELALSNALTYIANSFRR